MGTKMKLYKLILTIAVMLIMFGISQTNAQEDVGAGWYKLASSMLQDSIFIQNGGYGSDYCVRITVTASLITDSVVYARRVPKTKTDPLGTGSLIRFHVKLTNGMLTDLKLKIFHKDTVWQHTNVSSIYGYGTWETRFFNTRYAPMTEIDSMELTIKQSGPLGQQVTIDLDNFRNSANEVFYDGGEWASVSGTVWFDQNQNSVKDEGEKPLRGLKVYLGNGWLDSSYTDSAGSYQFQRRERGPHLIKPEPREFWTVTTHASGESTLVIANNPLYYSDINFGLYSDKASWYQVNRGWNIISVPKTGNNMAKTNLYPTAISQAFSYNNGYTGKDTLETGKGYWLKFADSEAVIAGNEFLQDTVTVTTGWNMIGAVSQPLAINSIISEPGGLHLSQFYGYNRGYEVVDTLRPNQGYWVKVIGEGGQLILNAATLKFAKTTGQNIVIVHLDELPPPAPGEGQNPSTVLGIPTALQLGQNYPNPFNPVTVIAYAIPNHEAGIMNHELVTLKVYNMLGQEVATLVNEMKTPGQYTVNFNGSNLTSGMYFYRLQAGNYTQTRKLLLLK
ncbi:MAG: T9SS type A sorting domain-containing protein [Bacteroidota bacterium]|nr:T9SS type A sorting domain-containing protein [Bacteroidota bacterium]